MLPGGSIHSEPEASAISLTGRGFDRSKVLALEALFLISLGQGFTLFVSLNYFLLDGIL
jgi:hypothetical protein